MCYVRAYLGLSTNEQDATRARDQLKAFAAERGLKIAAWYVENESGAKLARPELFRLLADAHSRRHPARRAGRPACPASPPATGRSSRPS